MPALVRLVRLPIRLPAGLAADARAELLEPDAVHALAFEASVVPHVGSDGPDGHFLASYETVAPR